MKNIKLLFILILCFAFQTKIFANQKIQPNDTIKIESIFPFQHQHCHGSTIVELPNKDQIGRAHV